MACPCSTIITFSKPFIINQFHSSVFPAVHYIDMKQEGEKRKIVDQGTYHHYYTAFVFIDSCYKLCD